MIECKFLSNCSDMSILHFLEQKKNYTIKTNKQNWNEAEFKDQKVGGKFA